MSVHGSDDAMSRLDGHWRDRVDGPNWFVRCASLGCGHGEQVHRHGHGYCTAGPAAKPCPCTEFKPGKRQWVGDGAPPEAA